MKKPYILPDQIKAKEAKTVNNKKAYIFYYRHLYYNNNAIISAQQPDIFGMLQLLFCYFDPSHIYQEFYLVFQSTKQS